MKLWIDDIRPAPAGYIWVKSVDHAKDLITQVNQAITATIEVLDIDHDAGDFAQYGGDYIKLLDWLEENNLDYPIHIHSMNPVGVMNMRAIIQKNGWKEV